MNVYLEQISENLLCSLLIAMPGPNGPTWINKTVNSVQVCELIKCHCVQVCGQIKCAGLWADVLL